MPGLGRSTYWMAQKVQNSPSSLQPGVEEPHEKQNHSLPVKKEGVPVTAHIEDILRKETTS